MYTMLDSCTIAFLYTYVKGGTDKYAVANTVVVYAYNMWYPCTVYVHAYTMYVHVYAMYIHVLTCYLNMVGSVPLIQLFLAGNSTPTIPVQPAQEDRLPSGQLLHCSSRCQAWQQYVSG